MRRWEILVSAYLLTVPLPYFVMEGLGIRLEYEQISWWLVGLYSAPLWLISEPLRPLPIPVVACIWWALALPVIGAWTSWRRQGRADRRG